MIFHYGLNYSEPNWECQKEGLRILLKTNKFLRNHLFIFHGMLTKFSKEISDGWAKKTICGGKKPQSHLSAHAWYPREVTLLSVYLYDGYLKWLRIPSEGFYLCGLLLIVITLVIWGPFKSDLFNQQGSLTLVIL